MPAQNSSVGGVLGAVVGTLGLSALAGLLVTVMVAPAIAVTGITATSTVGIFESLPDYLQLDEGRQTNKIVAMDGDTQVHIADYWYQNREQVSLDDMSPYLAMAAIDGEDRRFYDHGGVDVQSVVRAAIGGGDSGGASTLTMQLVRNIKIQQAVNDDSLTEEEKTQAVELAMEQSFDRKLREMKLAIGLEKRYDKKTILQAYLNIAGFGGNTYGVQAASQQYFSKNAKDLTIAESASLVAIVQYPESRKLSLPENYVANQERRDVILQAMNELGDITDAEYQEAVATPVDENFVRYQTPQSGCLSAAKQYRFACDYATRVVDEVESLGADAEERIANWKKGGYTLVLSVNPNMQEKADKTVGKYAPKDEKQFKLGAAVSTVEVGTGRILIMAQNKEFDNTEEGGGKDSTAVNFNTDQEHGGGSGFQPGSTYKPYVLLAFLDAGHGVEETFNASVTKVNQAKFKDTCGGPWGGSDFKFHNDANEKGIWTVARGTADSVNSVFVQMAAELDQCRIKELAASIGVHRGDGEPDGSDLATRPSCAIGGCENNIAPLTQAAAYAAIANEGVYCAPVIIDSVVGPDGAALPGQTQECGQSAVSPEVATAAAYTMEAAMVNGTAVESNPNDGTTYIAKTGTTDDAIHTWMVGSSRKASTAVWVGNISGKQSLRQVTVDGIQAAQLRHSIFRPIAKEIDKALPGKSFPKPEDKYIKGVQVAVPDLTGMTAEQAKAALDLVKLSYKKGGEEPSSEPAGTVIRTRPSAGSEETQGTVVKVYTSSGTGAEVPNVVGAASFNDAKATLGGAGFVNVSEVCEVIDPSSPTPPAEGTVIKQSPDPGETVEPDTKIELTTAYNSC
jgi:membrane peptidoglycan carboxypeptidase